jgi:two-component system OmpR family sensor kinase
MRAVPVRIRLTIGFALVMAVLLAGAGAYMYARVAADLDASIDRGLRARVADLSALVQQSDSGLRDAQGEGLGQAEFAQIVDRRGRILDATAGLQHRSLLSTHALHAARTHQLWVRQATLPGLDGGTMRLLAVPVSAQDRRLIVVAAASLDERARALDRVKAVMLYGGPALLILASLAGYALAALALRPVERMRVRAEGIWTHGLHARLPRTGAHDELDRLAATLNRSLDRVQSGVEREQGFVADASHELRTPLTVLRAQLELLGSGPGVSTEDLRAEIDSAIEEVDRLAELANNLLLLARADRGELELAAEPLLVGPVLERVGHRMDLLDRGTIEVVEPDAQLWVRGSEPRIEQALLNLVDNALRHGNGSVRIEARRAGDDVELHVVDDGPGFPEGFAASAFDRFTRGERGRSGDGAGLGLAIVRAIAEAHGGHAGAINRPGGGTDVWFSLPAATPTQEPSKASAQSNAGR